MLQNLRSAIDCSRRHFVPLIQRWGVNRAVRITPEISCGVVSTPPAPLYNTAVGVISRISSLIIIFIASKSSRVCELRAFISLRTCELLLSQFLAHGFLIISSGHLLVPVSFWLFRSYLSSSDNLLGYPLWGDLDIW